MRILVSIPNGEIKDTFIPPDVAKRLESIGDVLWNTTGGDYDGPRLASLLPGVDVCLTGWGTARFDEIVLRNADRLRLIAHTGGTVAPLVSQELYDLGIKVISGNWLYAESVAEGVIAYILCALREIPFYTGEINAGRWRTENYSNEGLLDKKVGLIGFGMVAKNLVKMLNPFRVKINAYDPFVTDDVFAEYGVVRSSLQDILSQSDIISIHAAHTDSTYHMITAQHLRTIRDGALFINTARGEIVDEEALAVELVTGRFQAVLDVFEQEPLPPDCALRGLKNVILMPHLAGPTMDRRKLVTLALIDEIENFFAGRPLRYEIGCEYAMSMTQ